MQKLFCTQKVTGKFKDYRIYATNEQLKYFSFIIWVDMFTLDSERLNNDTHLKF